MLSTSGSNRIHFPAEFQPQAALLLTWPDDETDWQDILTDVQETYIDLINKASIFVHPWIICRNLKSKQLINSKIHINKYQAFFSILDYDDTWVRDYGPLITQQNEVRHIHDFQFNGWGNKYAAKKDNLVTKKLWMQGDFEAYYLPLLQKAQPTAKLQYHTHDFVLEGGSIDTDNQGTIISSQECLLNTNRGDRKSSDIVKKLNETLGIHQVNWITKGKLIGDDTDAHIDTLVRFVNNTTLVYNHCVNTSDPHYQHLKEMEADINDWKNKQGSAYNNIALPLPSAQYNRLGERLPATYANFIILNEGILFPTYGCEEDKIALQIMQQLLPDKHIVTIDSSTLIKQSGSLHCATMQLPY